MKVFFQPQPDRFPERGGVAEHLRQLHFQLQDKVELVSNPNDADILHVESAWPIPQTTNKKKVVYVCHGGFVPSRLSVVDQNLAEADAIISVAQWLIPRYFPRYAAKTIVIPNGITLSEFESQSSENYVLYAKEWKYYFEDIFYLTQNSSIELVTTIWPAENLSFNGRYIGLQSTENMRRVLAKAGCLLLTGSEVCPTMLLEAWACNVPVVAKGIDGSFEIFSNHNFKGGMLYYEQEDMLGCIDTCLSNRSKLGQEGHEIAKYYQWKDLVNRYIEVYEKCLN